MAWRPAPTFVNVQLGPNRNLWKLLPPTAERPQRVCIPTMTHQRSSSCVGAENGLGYYDRQFGPNAPSPNYTAIFSLLVHLGDDRGSTIKKLVLKSFDFKARQLSSSAAKIFFSCGELLWYIHVSLSHLSVVKVYFTHIPRYGTVRCFWCCQLLAVCNGRQLTNCGMDGKNTLQNDDTNQLIALFPKCSKMAIIGGKTDTSAYITFPARRYTRARENTFRWSDWRNRAIRSLYDMRENTNLIVRDLER